MKSLFANTTKTDRKKIQKSVTFHGGSSDSNKNQSQNLKRKKRKSKVKRNSILKPSVYQKIQKKRRSESIDNKGSKSIQSSNIEKVDKRRSVFVSLKEFYQCWRLIPPHILFDAILILPLYREWITSPLKYKHEFNDILNDSKFVTLLQWKDKQGLIFFMLNSNAINSKTTIKHRINNQDNTDKHIIAPFWYDLSDKLQSLYDPDTSDSYKPLLLDIRWWKCAYLNKDDSRYNVSINDILNELWFLTMKFKTISEILFQSNPSLNIVINSNDLNLNKYQLPQQQIFAIKSILSESEEFEIDKFDASSNDDSDCKDDDDEEEEEEEEEEEIDNMEWWICPDYYYDTYTNKIDTDCDTDY